MSGLGKLFLMLGLIAVAGLLVIGGGAWYWWKHHSAGFLEAGTAAIEDGRKSGASLQEGGCLNQAVTRHKDGGPSMTSTIRNSVWLTGCLDTSSPQADFCEGVPSPENPVAVGVWAAGACIQHALGDPYCSNLFQNVSTYCASTARTGKMTDGPPPMPPT